MTPDLLTIIAGLQPGMKACVRFRDPVNGADLWVTGTLHGRGDDDSLKFGEGLFSSFWVRDMQGETNRGVMDVIPLVSETEAGR